MEIHLAQETALAMGMQSRGGQRGMLIAGDVGDSVQTTLRETAFHVLVLG
jgi:hypothetical protein